MVVKSLTPLDVTRLSDLPSTVNLIDSSFSSPPDDDRDLSAFRDSGSEGPEKAVPQALTQPGADAVREQRTAPETEVLLLRDGSLSDPAAALPPEIHFHSHFVGIMTMYADRATVADYLDRHPEWFRHCAQPMPVELVAKNSYALRLGRYGALGHALEPQICLELLPSDQEGVYRIETVPLGTPETQGYEVDFNASLHLVEKPLDPALADRLSLTHHTDAEWSLDLEVVIHLPRLLQRLPLKLIEQTGDRVLEQIVGQISRRLTRKVQEDFHSARNLPLPKLS
ncbi:MAG: DUF1997 domain-containing protein [Prochlorothrix sp.]|nr:DUF1997 domain-containing protein [Prochlorothrix sp.]